MGREKKDIFLTNGVNSELPFEHKLYLMNFMNEHGDKLLDDFQIFEFYEVANVQSVKRKQEQPEQSEVYQVPLRYALPITTEVWVIYEDGYGWVIMYPSEY